VVVVEPFRCQNTVGVLSLSVAMETSEMFVVEEMTPGYATAAASSKSLFVIVPVGLVAEIKCDLVLFGRL
jgi:hypothetical protein